MASPVLRPRCWSGKNNTRSPRSSAHSRTARALVDVKVGLVRKDDVHSPVSLLKANHLMAQQVSLPAKTSQQRSIDGVPGGEPIRLELLVDHALIQSRSNRIVGVKINYGEVSLRVAARAGGATWDANAKLYRMPHRLATRLGLLERIKEA